MIKTKEISSWEGVSKLLTGTVYSLLSGPQSHQQTFEVWWSRLKCKQRIRVTWYHCFRCSVSPVPEGWGGSRSREGSSPPAGDPCWRRCAAASAGVCFWRSGRRRHGAGPRWPSPRPRTQHGALPGRRPYPLQTTRQSEPRQNTHQATEGPKPKEPWTSAVRQDGQNLLNPIETFCLLKNKAFL